MSDEKALLAAIWEHPHEDTPRLMYADWLQENGQPERAEFVRVQIEHAKYLSGDPQASQLWSRQYDLHLKHSKIWRKDFPACLKQADFHRGFPYPRRTFRAAQLVAVTTAEWDAAPTWNVSLSQHSRAALATVLECPRLARIGQLGFSVSGARNRSLHPDDAVQLVRATGLRNLTELSLSFLRVGPAIIRALCEPDSLPSLVRLWLYRCDIGAGGVEALAASPLAERLESLAINSNGLGANDLRPLFTAFPRFSRLRHLGIGGNKEPDAIVRALVAHAAPRALESLHIGGGELTAEGMILVAAWPGAAQLTQLDVHRYPGGHGAGAVRALIESPQLTSIRRLTCPLAPESRDALAAVLQERFGYFITVT